MILLSSFSIGPLPLDMWATLRSTWFSSETPLKETFGSNYQLQIASGLIKGAFPTSFNLGCHLRKN